MPSGATDAHDGGILDNDWIVDLGGACVGATGTSTLVAYLGALFLAPIPDCTPICLGPSTPSRIATAEPGYETCAPRGSFRALQPAYPRCALLNPGWDWDCGPVPAASRSFGALKARY